MAGITQGPSRTTAAAAWVGDFLDREHLIAGGARLDPTQFLATDAVVATVGAAGAAADATSIPVAALTGAIPNGTVLDFGGKKFARLTAAAAAGATALTVSALATALVQDDAATYPGIGKKTIVSGTPIGRTYAERDALTAFGPAVSTDDEIYLVAFDIADVALYPDVDLYRPGSLVKETFVPGWSGFSSNLKTAIRSRYHCTIAAN